MRHTLEEVFSAPPDTRTPLRKLASELRELAEEPITFDDLYAVKAAGEAPAMPVIDEDKPGAALRKLAHDVRVAGHAHDVQRFEKVALARRAVRGLTLLNERISR